MQILLDKILKLVEKDRRLQAQRIKDGDTFNVFSILGLQSYEVRTHSAFIGELLSPTGSHGCNDKLLAAFLKSVIIYVVKKQGRLFSYRPKTSSFQYSCRFSLMQFITSEKSICSFQRIFFKNAFHQALRVSSWANVFVNRARLSLYDVFLFLKVLTMASSRRALSIS